MNKTININVTLCPHVVKGKPRGYYLLAERLFIEGAPILNKHQFVGYLKSCGELIVTVDHPNHLDTIGKMVVLNPNLTAGPVSWIAPVPLFQMSKGFRTYIPGWIFKPASAESEKVTFTGYFESDSMLKMYYLRIPVLSGEVLIGRKKI